MGEILKKGKGTFFFLQSDRVSWKSDQMLLKERVNFSLCMSRFQHLKLEDFQWFRFYMIGNDLQIGQRKSRSSYFAKKQMLLPQAGSHWKHCDTRHNSSTLKVMLMLTKHGIR